MASLLEDLLKPISDASFCGEDGSYESEYETARAEADKNTENDFALMAEASKQLLVKKSKDMRALGYLALGTALSQGLTPFAEAVQAYCKLATEHWNDIHPKRATARANALKWLNLERSLSLISAVTGGGDYEALSKAAEDLGKFQTFCDTKFPEAPPSFAGFYKVVKELAQKNKPQEKPPEPTPAEAAAQATAAASGGGGAPGKLASIDDCYLAVQNAAYYLLEQNRSNALGYRLTRIVKWDMVRENPNQTNGRTMIPAPQSHVLETFRNLFNNKQWPDLVKNGEEVFSGEGAVLWLDLQRFLCVALAGLGGDNAACAKAIMMELALLLQRAPDLPSLEFDDGTPFADAMTKEWIQGDVKSALGGEGGGAALAPIKKKGDVGEEQKQAETLLNEGKLEQALMVLRTGLVNDSSQKNNFDRKLIMAELCYKGNKPQIAKALLEDLISSMDRFALSQWDPDLCVTVYHMAQKVYLSLFEAADEVSKPALREKAVAMHTLISKLNPVLAIGTDFK